MPHPSEDAGLQTRSSGEPERGGRLGLLGQGALDRLYAFRVTYVAIFVFIVLYVFSVKGAEGLLQRHFETIVEQAIHVTDFTVPVTTQIQNRIDRRVTLSHWVRWGGVKVTVIVLASDARTWIYAGGRTIPRPASLDPAVIAREAERLLPATEEVIVSVPHNALLANAILVSYAAILLCTLFFYNRAVSRGESRRLGEAVAARDLTLLRTQSIEQELEAVRRRMLEVEPAEREHTEEIRALQNEREALQAKVTALARREEDLRLKAARAVELDQERQALEDLLEEAGSDLATKDQEIRGLEKTLKRSGAAGGSTRVREADLLARRFETLYKNLEIDGHALSNLVALKDEVMKLKAEEAMKRLAEETENLAIRRKVGGLPASHVVFELGFAGKGRIYYTKGVKRRFRILAIGAKNTQSTDLEYLRRLSF